jgi:hypothetical protein
MKDALLGADRAIADDDRVEIGSDAKAHALTVTAAFVRSQRIHCRLGRLGSLNAGQNPQKVGQPRGGTFRTYATLAARSSTLLGRL